MELIPFFSDTVKIEVENESITFWIETNPLLPEYPSILVRKAKCIISDKHKNIYFLIRFRKKLCLFRVCHLDLLKYSTSRRDYLYMTLETYGKKLADFKELFDFPIYRAAIALDITGVFIISEEGLNSGELKEIGVAYLCLLSKGEIRRKAYEFVMENK